MRITDLCAILLAIVLLAGACAAEPHEPQQTPSTVAPSGNLAQVTEGVVREALQSIASGNHDQLLSLVLPEDRLLLDTANRNENAGDVMLSRLTAGLVTAFGPTGIPSLRLSYVGTDSGYQRVDVGPSEAGPTLPVFVTGPQPEIDLLASFSAYVASDLLTLAKNDPEMRALLADRTDALELSDARALPNLRSQPGKLKELIRFLSA